jgi:hypothetical protein
MSVYLDATFFPQLRELDFKQEGHRLEFLEDGSLEVKGIVYNEMKGAMVKCEIQGANFFRQNPPPCLYANFTGYSFPLLRTDTILEEIQKLFAT